MAALTVILFACLLPSCLSTNDTDALTLFRSGADVHGVLASNWTAGDACAAGWLGVRCFRGRVAALSLPSIGLRGGPLDPLARLDQLRVLDLHSNRLNGTVLPVANCSNLKLLYLAGNDFSGDIPPEIASLRRLLRLDLSDNNLRGPIPAPLTNLTRLLTLRLQDNALSGPIPSFAPDSPLAQLDLSNNQLYGPVPDALLSRFGNRSFAGNQGLCGWGPGSSPFPVCSGAPPPVETTVPSNPSSLPTRPTNGNRKQGGSGLSSGAIVAIVIGNAVLLLVLASFAVAYCCGRPSRDSGRYSYDPKGSIGNGDQNKVYDSSDAKAAGEEEPGRLVFYDRKKQFDLEDLLRASAEMLGKGGFGTVYRAVLEDGGMVAVKRLKDANPCPRREFEQYMDMIGRLKHPNIAHLRAYYYAKEEKLLVYEYLPNGNLHSLLHGNRGPGRIPLDWTTRISLVLGAARGLARIHEEYNVAKIPHGNVKSSNILLDDNGIARVSDFGLSLLLNPVHAAARLGGYRAPEQVETRRLSQKADVYSFGIVLLEVLTGKAPSQPHASPVSGISIPGGEEEEEEEEGGLDLPRWVRSVVRDEWTAEVFDQELLRYKNIEEELVMMLQVGLACVAPQPEKRPSMLHVVKMIEDIRVEQSPFVDDLNESRTSHRSGY